MSEKDKFMEYVKNEESVNNLIREVSLFESMFINKKFKLHVKCINCSSEYGDIKNGACYLKRLSNTFVWCCKDCFLSWNDFNKELDNDFKNLNSISIDTVEKLKFEKNIKNILDKIHQSKTLNGINYYMKKMQQIKLSILMKSQKNIELSKLIEDIIEFKSLFNNIDHLFYEKIDLEFLVDQVTVLIDCFYYYMSYFNKIYLHFIRLISLFDIKEIMNGNSIIYIDKLFQISDIITKTHKQYNELKKTIQLKLKNIHKKEFLNKFYKNIDELSIHSPNIIKKKDQLPIIEFKDTIEDSMKTHTGIISQFGKLLEKYGFKKHMYFGLQNILTIAKHIKGLKECTSKDKKRLETIVNVYDKLSKL